MTFVYYLTLAYVATTLLIGGIGHLLNFAQFRELVRSHGIIPARLATLASILTLLFEAAVGTALLAVLLDMVVAPLALVLFTLSAAGGCAFALYIRLLLRRPSGVTSCGCSPFAGPLTPASMLPASALLLMSLLGLAATSLGFARPLEAGYELLGVAVALPLVWGLTLTIAIFMLPASLPPLRGLWQTDGADDV